MKYDREEAYLHEKLTGGLHPAGVDLWPAVAEHLPDAPPARHPRWKLAICLAAPLLIAMFLAEFGLALISRFAPSLNVFVLAMPIKSAVASLLLVIYIKLMMDHAYRQVLAVMDPLRLLIPILEAR